MSVPEDDDYTALSPDHIIRLYDWGLWHTGRKQGGYRTTPEDTDLLNTLANILIEMGHGAFVIPDD